jgi:hypothetical protein
MTYLQVRKILMWIYQLVKNLKDKISSSGVKILLWIHQVAIVLINLD